MYTIFTLGSTPVKMHVNSPLLVVIIVDHKLPTSNKYATTTTFKQSCVYQVVHYGMTCAAAVCNHVW